ncbi:MAG: LysM peptidoglycan-binding domain-containing protein [Gammaproteobacteria bacterium]|nr:LysM peptidoglycan-binding domain-containing protein [Gammaproteobacteria bacterium]
MYQRLLIAILFGFLALEAATAQERDAVFSPISAKNRINSIDQSVKSLKLKGVLISSSSRTALVNGRPVQEGDRIGGAEVLEIEQRGIRVLVGSRELTLNVGSSIAVDAPATRVARSSGAPARPHRKQQQLVAEGWATPGLQGESGDAPSPRHAVQAGETLSGIAFQYRQSGVSLEQMMMALFEANPKAFNDNINVVQAGAVLRIPDANELHRQAPAVAAAEVARHAARWQSADRVPLQVADMAPEEEYHAVKRGETLSEIASRMLHDGITLDQMIMALYAANPMAFSENINVLHEGATLRIPAQFESSQLTPETATAEVVRQTNLWRTDQEQDPLPDPPDANIMASVDVLLD